MPYVSSDGNYGGDDPIIFDHSELTSTQWANLEEMSDLDRFEYVFAILNSDDEATRELEDAYDLDWTV